MSGQEKQCRKCTEIKALTCFSKSTTHKDGYYASCKKCRSISSSKWNKANRERTTNNSLLWKYGINLDQYQLMLTQQEGKCFCCKKDQSQLTQALSVDHCHTTGKVRGLLCQECNKAIGLIKDNVETAERITQYLKDHYASNN